MHAERTGMRTVFAVLMLVAVAVAAPVAFSGDSSAANIGSTSAPRSSYTGTITEDGKLYAYIGAELNLTFQAPSGYTSLNLYGKADYANIDVDGMTVTGTVSTSTMYFYLEGTKNGEYDTIITFNVSGMSTTVLSEGYVGVDYSADVAVPGTHKVDPECTLVSGNLPTGLSIDADGNITGVPTAQGEYFFTVSAKVSMGGTISMNLYRSITISVDSSLTTTTSVSSTHLYVVEGKTVSFTVTGTTSSGSAYAGTVTTTGGKLSKTSVSSGDTVTFTAPDVSSTKNYTVTVTSANVGHKTSSAKVTVTVVEALTVSAPEIGKITSS